MSGTTMVVMIVLISVGFGMIGEWVKRYLAFKEKSLQHSGASEELKKDILDTAEKQRALPRSR